MDGNNIAHMAYLLIIVLFVGSFVVRSYSGKSKTALKHFFIWCALFSVIFVVFSYRDKFSSVKENVMGELFPSKTQKGDGGEIIIHKSIGGHFYIDIEINDVVIKFMVDTGASRVVLSKRDAFLVGINDSELNFKNMVYTANGTIMTAPVLLENIYIEGYQFKNVSGMVNGGDMKNSLLGMSFLKKLQSFTIENNRLIMVP